MGQYSPTGPKNPYRPMGQSSGMQSLKISSPFGTQEVISRGQFSRNEFDTKLNAGATSTTEQFKGLPATGFTPGANEAVGGGLLFQQRLRLMFVELVRQGMSHKDAAIHIQKTTGFHARTGQKLAAKVGFTKEKKVTYAGRYGTHKPYRGTAGRSGHHRPRRSTPAGLK
jgi:hypothetical protein